MALEDVEIEVLDTGDVVVGDASGFTVGFSSLSSLPNLLINSSRLATEMCVVSTAKDGAYGL